MRQDYPDISPILASKTKRRSALAALSWEEKVTIVERMRNLLPRGMWKDQAADRSPAIDPLAEKHEP